GREGGSRRDPADEAEAEGPRQRARRRIDVAERQADAQYHEQRGHELTRAAPYLAQNPQREVREPERREGDGKGAPENRGVGDLYREPVKHEHGRARRPPPD